MHFFRCFVATAVIFAATAIAMPTPDDYSYDLSAREDYDSGLSARSNEDLVTRDYLGGELYYPRDYADLESREYEISDLNSREQNPSRLMSRDVPVHLQKRYSVGKAPPKPYDPTPAHQPPQVHNHFYNGQAPPACPLQTKSV